MVQDVVLKQARASLLPLRWMVVTVISFNVFAWYLLKDWPSCIPASVTQPVPPSLLHCTGIQVRLGSGRESWVGLKGESGHQMSRCLGVSASSLRFPPASIFTWRPRRFLWQIAFQSIVKPLPPWRGWPKWEYVPYLARVPVPRPPLPPPTGPRESWAWKWWRACRDHVRC